MPNAQDDQWKEAVYDTLYDAEAGLSSGSYNDEWKKAIMQFRSILEDIDRREESEFKRIAGLCPQDGLSFGDGLKVAEHINLKEDVKKLINLFSGNSLL